MHYSAYGCNVVTVKGNNKEKQKKKFKKFQKPIDNIKSDLIQCT
ncbi:hypothetical protein Alsa2_CDS0129 [Staphylococcus phage Alsa_2]|nr:hypothetical protein Alsa2_CDS0129 [Staphylococcus phage Alsa_2]